MKIALVHDYIKEYGGAERVLEVLHEMYPDAPIYTAFYKKDSLAYEKFKTAKIIPSWVQHIPFFSTKLHSPLRFLAPVIWGSFDFSGYDMVISSASWYSTKGFKKKNGKPIEICYCHTPPRWLYGYKTSIEWQKYWPVKMYGNIVGRFMRRYDYKAAQRVDYFLANSEEVKQRIKKFYNRDAEVVYPPVSLPPENSKNQSSANKKKDYYFMVARLVGGKGFAMAIEAAKKTGITLKIAGAPGGYYGEYQKLSKNEHVEFLGHVTDEELVQLYRGAKAFFALSQDEDFGITPVEAMLCGTPVIAYYGGGYKETVVDGKTGIFFRQYTVESLIETVHKFETMRFKPEACKKQAQKFSKGQFISKMTVVVSKAASS